MAYNTNNPVGSTDPRDLFDNAGNMDKFENGPNPFYPDRFGVQKLSRSGMIENYNNMIDGQASAFNAAQSARDSEFAAFLESSGFVSLGNYTGGLEFTRYHQYIARGGFFYRPAPSSIPFTTTGTWVGADEDLFVLFSQDDALRQDLANPDKGAAMVARAVIYAESVEEVETMSLPVGTAVFLTEAGRSGEFVVKSGTPPSDPQKGIYIVLANGNYAERIVEGPYYVTWFGAVGDGVTDDTAAINACLKFVYTNNGGAGETAFFPAGTFVSGRISVGSNISIVLSPATILSGLSGAFPGVNDSFISIAGQENVTIMGFNALVTMPKSEFTSGEGRHAVNIYNSKNVKIYDLRTKDSGGDGFYVGAPKGSFCENILLSNCYADSHRRQGLSVISVKGLTVDGGVYSNTSGTAPEAGIDLEPNYPSDFLQNIHIRNVHTNQNQGAGVLFALMNLDSTSAPVSITVENHVSRVDGVRANEGSLRFVGPTAPVKGSILIQGGGSNNVPASPIKIDFWPVTAPRVTIKDREDVDFGSRTGNVNRCCVAWFMRASDPVVNQGNFLFENITSNSTNDRAVAHTWLNRNGTSGEFHDIEIINCKAKAGQDFIITDRGNLSVIQPDHYTVISNGSFADTFSRNPGRIIIPSTTQTMTLPSAADFFGRVVKARLNSSSTVFTIAPATGTRISGYSYGESIVLRDAGDTVYLTPVSSDTWAFVKSFKWNQNQFWK